MRKLCGECHRFPEPEVQPRGVWPLTISRMSRDPLFGKNIREPIDLAAITAWYEERAPLEHVLESAPETSERSLALDASSFSPAETSREDPMVSCVRLVDVEGDRRLEIVVADMRHGVILIGRPDEPMTPLRTLARTAHPARVEVVDLDGDGRRDVVVSNLGTLPPEDHSRGTVELLRGTAEEGYDSLILARGFGRVSDAQPGDFDADGDLDLAVAEFGQITTGSVTLLENRTTDWARPDFRKHRIEPRHGATQALVLDLDGDGRLDVVAQLAQEHEMVVAYLNRGGWTFETRVLAQAPHPEWGSTGITSTDLDRDGDADFLLTNGDTLDTGRAHPDHGVEWLENRGERRFERRRIGTLYGVQAARAADLDGDGDLDVVACAFLDRKQRPDIEFIAMAWWEQQAPGEWERHVLEAGSPVHQTLDVADVNGDGQLDIASGNAGVFESVPSWATLRRSR